MRLIDIYDMQIAFARRITNKKYADLSKQKFSVIAELVEFNEELPIDMTHKYWKKNSFNEEKMLTELGDTILFLFECMATLDKGQSLKNVEDKFENMLSDSNQDVHGLFLYDLFEDIITYTLNNDFENALSTVISLFEWLGVDKNKLTEVLLRKIIRNYERLSKEEWV